MLYFTISAFISFPKALAQEGGRHHRAALVHKRAAAAEKAKAQRPLRKLLPTLLVSGRVRSAPLTPLPTPVIPARNEEQDLP